MAPFINRPRPRVPTMPFPSSPVCEDLFHRRAHVSLKIVVVGGSIAGLATAYNLKQAGHDVRVLEKSDGKLKFSAGVRVPPNMAKLLLHWGIGDKLREKSIICPRIDFMDDVTGEFLSMIVYHKELMKELQADVYNLPYSDLFEMIRDLTLRSGVKIDYNATVVDVDVNAPSLLLKSGETINADMIVGADGAYSLVRERLLGYKEKREIGPHSAYFYTIPASEMQKDPLLAPLIKDGTWKMWTGDMRCILSYLASPEQYAMCVIPPTPSTRPGWSETVPIPQSKYSDADERLKRLLSLADRAIESHYYVQDSLESWYQDEGKVVLVGNAVHVTSPESFNQTALAVEDGAVLGSLLSRLHTNNPDEIVRLLAAYQEVRQDRCTGITATDVELLRFSCLPPGPARDQRNAGFRALAQSQALDWEDVGEDVLRKGWEEFRSTFGYEAYDAADDWWVDWGIVVQRISAGVEDEDRSENGFSSAGIRASLLNGLQTQTVISTVENTGVD